MDGLQFMRMISRHLSLLLLVIIIVIVVVMLEAIQSKKPFSSNAQPVVIRRITTLNPHVNATCHFILRLTCCGSFALVKLSLEKFCSTTMSREQQRTAASRLWLNNALTAPLTKIRLQAILWHFQHRRWQCWRRCRRSWQRLLLLHL